MIERGRLLVVLSLCMASAGCAAPRATLELITAARKGIHSARQDAIDRHDEAIKRLEAQVAALDAAFDADVRLVAAGQVADADGEPVELTAEWIISARKGYAAARGLLAEQMRSAEAARAAGLDNLDAADESLEMASQLIVSRWNVAERVKQHLLSLQRRLANE